MNATEQDTHMAVWEAENPAESAWERWIEQVENQMRAQDRMPADCYTLTADQIVRLENIRANGYGCWRVDGDQKVDQFSLDAFFQLWLAKRTPQEALAEVAKVVLA